MTPDYDFEKAVKDARRRAQEEWARIGSLGSQIRPAPHVHVTALQPDEGLEQSRSLPVREEPQALPTQRRSSSSERPRGTRSHDAQREIRIQTDTDGERPEPVAQTARPQPDVSKGYSGLVSARKRPSVSSASHAGTKMASRARHPDDSDSADETSRPAKRPFAPAKKPARLARPVYEEILPVETRVNYKPSEWYQTIDMRQKFARSDLVAVQTINGLIRDCQRKTERGGDGEVTFQKIRLQLHKMEFYDFLSGVIVKKSKVLDDGVGLPQIFDDAGDVGFPWDIKEDAQMLYSRSMRGILDPHLLRGIETVRRQIATGKATMSRALQKDYCERASCNVVGANNLHNGQWWPLQLCAIRDGAHGEIEAGIHGQAGRGAFSIVLSSGEYADVDDGEDILYCGTSGAEGAPTAGTKLLLETHRLKQPLRVLRSAALPRKNAYRPEKGLRYDGLYDVVGFEVIHPATAMHRFSLRRGPDQHPIRYRGVERRPTDQELLEISKIKKLLSTA